MADLPPRAPNPTINHRFSSTGDLAPNESPSWVDEFFDFTASRRGSHRRSMSDSVTFFEFDRFDDEQFMSMFTDEVPPAVRSNPSTPSDNNSVIEVKTEPEEVESFCMAMDGSQGRTVDPKRVKRILANRQSAQRSRVRKLQYISDLERSVTSLQAEVSLLSPRVAFLDQQRMILNIDNSALKQRIAALAQDKIFKDAHQEALKSEIDRLRTVYHHIKQKKECDMIPLQPSLIPVENVADTTES